MSFHRNAGLARESEKSVAGACFAVSRSPTEPRLWRVDRTVVPSRRLPIWMAGGVLGLALLCHCGVDDFEPPVEDGTGAEAPGMPGGGEAPEPGAGGGGGGTEVMGVVEACTALCEARFSAGCRQTDTAGQCAGYCSFFTLTSAACQSAVAQGFSCQLLGDPCSPESCNNLLRAAEVECAEYIEILQASGLW